MSDATKRVDYVTLVRSGHSTIEMPETQDIPAWLASLDLINQAQEAFWVVPVDARLMVHSVVEVARGDMREVVVSIRLVLAAVLTSGTDRFFVVHNHPEGDPTPSPIDLELTQKIANAASACGLRFEDHIIIGPPHEVFSMVGAGLMVSSARPLGLRPTNEQIRSEQIQTARLKALD